MEHELRAERPQPQRSSSGAHRPEPDEQHIRKRAHAIWIEESKPDGRALDHWLRARWELEQAPDPKAEFDRLEHELEPPGKKDENRRSEKD